MPPTRARIAWCLRGGQVAFAVFAVALTVLAAPTSATASTKSADTALDKALARFVATPGGPPAAAVVVQRGKNSSFHTAGVADVPSGAKPGLGDYMRVASVAKAYTGAVALSVVADGLLSLDDTVGEVRPDLSSVWAKVTLAQLMAHTSGIPDFSQSPAFGAAVTNSLLVPPPPAGLVTFVSGEPLLFTPGSKYAYSNSDNIIIGLMVETATGHPFAQELAARVSTPLKLTGTSLPNGIALPTPTMHGYSVDPPAPPEDDTEVYAAGWAWTSGGIVSTPADANNFIRGYAAGTTTNRATRADQFTFRPGSSEPPGPGKNSAGLSIFRYDTPCGTVYGHTGNAPGYTQFIAATADGSRSTTVSINAQMTPKTDPEGFRQLRRIYGLAVCAALAK